MNPRKFLVTASIALTVLALSGTLAFAQAMPHAVIGAVTDSEGHAVAGADITVTNQRTLDMISGVTNSTGHYQADLFDLTSGYLTGDIISVTAETDELFGEAEFTVSSTQPFDECDIVVSEKSGFDSIIILGIIGGLFIIISLVGMFFMSRGGKEEAAKPPKQRRR